MDLHDYVAVLRARWLSVFLPALAGLAIGVAWALVATPVYQATTQVFVSVRSGSTATDLLQGSNFTRQQITSYAQTVISPLVLDPVAADLGQTDAAELARQISASSPLDTVLIDIAVDDTDPQRAADIANLTAESFAQVVGELETPDGESRSPVRVSVVRPAAVPETPASPNLRLSAVLGLVLGVLAGLGLALLRNALDTRVRDDRDVAAVTDVSVLGAIADCGRSAPGPLLVSREQANLSAEDFRRVRTNLQFASLVSGACTLLVTSSLQDEGKSTVAMNLALTIADTGLRVVLVDADLRQPSIAQYLGLEGAAGLTTVLVGRATLDDVIQPWGASQLHILPSGEVPPNPSELLGSGAMAALLQNLASRYDIVVVDSSPLLPVTDPAVLSRLTAGTILVAGCDRLHRGQLRAALDSLASVEAPLLGIVLNRVMHRGPDAYGYGHYGYVAEQLDGKQARRRRWLPPFAPTRRPPRSRGGQRSTTANRREEPDRARSTSPRPTVNATEAPTLLIRRSVHSR